MEKKNQRNEEGDQRKMQLPREIYVQIKKQIEKEIFQELIKDAVDAEFVEN